ncbi:amino acid ABC transporter permease [Pelagibacteraceae bacterium]|nr:amino acid ABC transporter permease [Pelagibacteraceae bacterium]
MLDYKFQWRVVWQRLPDLLEGAILTLELTILSSIIGLLIASILVVWQKSDNSFLRNFTKTWISIARNTPALLQIYMAYFGLGSFGIHLSSYVAVLGAIAFNNAGYMTEILRGGFTSISKNQNQAAKGLGLNNFQTYMYVIYPQVLKTVFLPMTNQFIWAMMGTSLGIIIGLQELTGMTTFLQSQTFRPFEFYFIAALIYIFISKSILLSSGFIAKRYLRI